MRIGYDFDDIVFPWYDRAHQHCVEAGITNGVEPTTWTPYEEYGVTLEQWLEVLEQGTLAGTLTGRGRPYPGAVQELRKVKTLGHEIIIVTARGYFKHGHRIKAQTKRWLKTWKVPYDELYFTKDKASVALDMMVDDNVGNYDMLVAAGVETYLLNRPWNQRPGDDRIRIDTLEQYTAKITENYGTQHPTPTVLSPST